MTIPDYQTLMSPVLRYLSDGREHSLRETIQALSDEFGLKDEERKEMLPSGKQPLVNNRVAWAVTYLRQAELLENIKRGVFAITERGRQVLSEYPDGVDNSVLERFKEFQEFKTRTKDEKRIPYQKQTTIGRPEIQRFAGALLGKAAKKGIFLTTSKFTREAEEYVEGLDAKIILIDGERLAELMIEYSVGVNTVATYEIKKIDSDYFIEE